jgi:hypothetical protein
MKGTRLSAKTLAEKLQIKPNSSFWLSDEERLDLIAPLPDGVQFAPGPDQATVALMFVNDAASTRALLDANRAGVTKPAAFWIAYPKANRTDINRDTLWPILSEYGMRPISQVAIDEVWSALRFRPLKDGEAPFTGG